MLVDIDDYENGDKEKDSSRVINQVKAGLHTCSELTVWIKSIKSKYVITHTVKLVTFCLIFVSLLFGTSFFMVDVSTDLNVNSEWFFLLLQSFHHLSFVKLLIQAQQKLPW